MHVATFCRNHPNERSFPPLRSPDDPGVYHTDHEIEEVLEEIVMQGPEFITARGPGFIFITASMNAAELPPDQEPCHRITTSVFCGGTDEECIDATICGDIASRIEADTQTPSVLIFAMAMAKMEDGQDMKAIQRIAHAQGGEAALDALRGNASMTDLRPPETFRVEPSYPSLMVVNETIDEVDFDFDFDFGGFDRPIDE